MTDPEYAFPRPTDSTREDRSGMTLRDYFAAHAPVTVKFAVIDLRSSLPDGRDIESDQLMKRWADLRYDYADAMLEARK